MLQKPRAETMRTVPIHGGPRENDLVAVESPLQVMLDGEPFAVVMRTPGDDRSLVVGFLFSERVVDDAADVAAIEIGVTEGGRDLAAVALRTPRSGGSGDRRQVNVNAACGMCGRVRVESLEIDRDPIEAAWQIDLATLAALPDRLRGEQPVFARTGGLHAAAVFGLDGRRLAAAEDVGRHNAVDKVVGRLLMEGRLPLAEAMLVVSGRTAFEIVQKALLAGCPLVVSVSAPSSLAVELADAAGITLAGFAREGRCNIYTHPQRVCG